MSHISTPHRRTLARSVAMQGTGLHTGESVHLTLSPNPGKGRVCRRVDCEDGEIPASLHHISRVGWATILTNGRTEISTVEHLLAALYAAGIDDVLIEVNGPEVPACDGSAREYVELVESAGVRDTGLTVEPVLVAEPIWIPGENKHILAFPADILTITYAVDYDHPVIGKQCITLDITDATFRDELAPARTFALVEWIEDLRRRGLAKGGSLENAVVVYREGYSSALRFEDEMVRHKALDLIGDLALIGRPVCAHIIAVRCSHAMHIAMAQRLCEQANIRIGDTGVAR